MRRTQIQLSDAQAESLRRATKKRGVSMAELVREAVDTLLDEEAEVSHGERVRRALDACGKLGSGHSDVAENHDAHLVEAYSR
jgi:Arc/MetJ-type ribon-helix-helix transcriptional regulator